jgi:hypothetical protein
MRVAGLLLSGVLGACNPLFGLDPTALRPEIDASLRPDGDPHADLDRDGIKDVVDSCIAPTADRLFDTDFDMVANGIDPCPLDSGAGADPDGDGLGDICDPYPATAGDRQRCLMTFTDPDMDVAMWKARDTVAMPWTLFEPRELIGRQGSIVADWPFESPAVTTYDVRGLLLGTHVGDFSVLPRAGLVPQPTDVGCVISMSGAAWTIDTVPSSGAPAAVNTSSEYGVKFRLLVTIAPKSSDDLRCSVSIAGALPVSVATRVSLPVANLGFSTSTYVAITGLAIYERDDAPAL